MNSKFFIKWGTGVVSLAIFTHFAGLAQHSDINSHPAPEQAKSNNIVIPGNRHQSIINEWNAANDPAGTNVDPGSGQAKSGYYSGTSQPGSGNGSTSPPGEISSPNQAGGGRNLGNAGNNGASGANGSSLGQTLNEYPGANGNSTTYSGRSRAS